MRRRSSKIRVTMGKQAVLSLLVLLAMLIQPLDLRPAGAPCVPLGHDCCQHLSGSMGATCPVSSFACSITCSTDRSATFLVNSRESSGRADLQFSNLGPAVTPAFPLNLAHVNRHMFSLPVSPPLTPLSQTCLLLI